MSYDVGVSALEIPKDIVVNCKVFNLEVGCLSSLCHLLTFFSHTWCILFLWFCVCVREREREGEREETGSGRNTDGRSLEKGVKFLV